MILGFCLGGGIPLMITVWFVGRYHWRRRERGAENRERERWRREVARKRDVEVEAARKRTVERELEDLKRRKVVAEEVRKKRAEEHNNDAPDLGVFKLQEQMPLNSQRVIVTVEDVDGIEDAPPSYDWEASGSRYGWERGESSHEGAEHVSDEERGLLKGPEHQEG
jgi:hypothetical protein